MTVSGGGGTAAGRAPGDPSTPGGLADPPHIQEQLTFDEDLEPLADWLRRVSQHQPQQSEED